MMKNLGLMMGIFAVILDPLVAKSVDKEGYTDLKN